jgi:hypothetical protein
MATLFILTVVFAIIPAASVWFGADSRDLQHADLRSLVS